VIGKIGILSAAFLTAFLTPIVGLLVTCFVFTVVDMVYGIKVAKRQNKKITSDANWHGTIRKIIDEFTVIGLARLLEYTVLGS
jgi:phage-related holin